MSPLIFVAALDYFVRRLAAQEGDDKVRAFADDLRVTTRNVLQRMPALAAEFRELERTSGLSLNLEKTVVIPLWPTDTAELRGEVEARAPDWAGAQCRLTAKHLGFQVGPERTAHQWFKTEAKMVEKAKDWAKAGLGTYLGGAIYRMYVASIAGYWGQLVPCQPDGPARRKSS